MKDPRIPLFDSIDPNSSWNGDNLARHASTGVHRIAITRTVTYAVTVRHLPIPRATFINIYASSRRNGPISGTPNRRASSRLTSRVRRNQLRRKQTGPFRS